MAFDDKHTLLGEFYASEGVWFETVITTGSVAHCRNVMMDDFEHRNKRIRKWMPEDDEHEFKGM